MWRGVGRWKVFPRNPLTGFFGFFGARDNLVSDRGLRRLVADNLKLGSLEESPIRFTSSRPICSAAGSFATREDALEAVIASAAIPGIFPAVEREGRLLIDGGVANNTPMVDAIELGAERIYVLPTGNAAIYLNPRGGGGNAPARHMSLLVMRRLLVEVEMLRDRAELIVLPPPCPLTIPPIDFAHADELIRRGYEDSRDYLEAVAAGSAPVPLPMVMHAHRHPALAA